MKNELRTLKFYCHDIISPLFIRNDKNIPKEDLNHDLNLITDDEIKQFAEKYSHIVEIEKTKSKDENIIKNELKYYILCEKIQKILGAARINCLLNNNLPYELDELRDLKKDCENLTSINNFEILSGTNTYSYKNNKYTLCLPINQNNSNYDLTLELVKLNQSKNVEILIRLDPLIRNYKWDFLQRGKVYGKDIKWKELCNIYERESVELRDDKTEALTEVLWERNRNEFHLKCEELPILEEVEERGSRCFHAIYNIEKDLITHCDGSIKIYNKEELINRQGKKLKDNPKNLGKYLKIFRADGSINTENFTTLIISFFKGNEDIKTYFNKTLN